MPMISVAALAGVPAWIRSTFGERVLRQANRAATLDIELIEHHNCFIPQSSMTRYLHEVERRTGHRQIGLLLAPHLSFRSYGVWSEYVLAASTLRDAISRAVSTLGYHSFGDRLELTVARGTARLSYINATRGLPGYAHVAIGSASVMVDLLRSYTEADWTPSLIGLCLPRPQLAGVYEDVFTCPVRFETEAVTVSFDARLLDRPCANPKSSRPRTSGDLARLRFNSSSVSDIAGAVTAQVWAQVLAGDPSIDNAARALDTSVRSLQRMLNRDGIDFRGLVNNMRVLRAKELLAETRFTVSEISSELGYSTPSNFARAFRSLTGMSPLDFRRHAGGIFQAEHHVAISHPK